MTYKISKHFDYLTPFSEAANDAELAKIMRLKYPKACSNLEVDAGFFARMVEDVQHFNAWRVIGFDSFEDFCRDELGKTLNEVESIVSGVKVLQSRGIHKPTAAEALAAAPKLQPTGRPKKGKETIPFSSKGPTVERLAARLKRDHPGICERVAAGEFRSIRAAAIAAGIVKVKTPRQHLEHWWNKATAAERKEFMRWCKSFASK